jgi:two-component system, OmpR family, response regulator BaeR
MNNSLNFPEASTGGAHVLVVEDEPRLAALLRDYLTHVGYRVTSFDNGEPVLAFVRDHKPDVVLLDLMLPKKDGLTLCREIRLFSDVPIMMLTARVAEMDRLLGLDLGADDYLCKPFSFREVVARVRALLRRRNISATASPEHTPESALQLDVERHEARLDGQVLPLTPVEFRLLNALHAAAGRVCPRAQLALALHREHRVLSDRTLDSHVKNLRKKLANLRAGQDLIASVYGIGYKLELPGKLIACGD